MIKIILFDADGVLLTGTMFSKYLQKYLGINEDIIQPFFDNEFQKCLTGEADIKKELHVKMVKKTVMLIEKHKALKATQDA